MSDKTATGREELILDATASYSRVTIVFDITSDDDPLQRPGTAAPVRTGIGTAQLQGGNKHYTTKLELRPKEMQEGTYALAFWDKEDDCHACFSIAHTVIVTVVKPCASPNAFCSARGQEASTLTKKVRQYENEFQQLLRAAPEIKQNLAGIKRIDDTCNWQSNFQTCDNQVRLLVKNLCPNVALGANPEHCIKLTETHQLLDRYRRELDGVRAQIRQRGCCYLYRSLAVPRNPNDK